MCMTIKDKYIDPLTDFGFKKIFGSEENKRFLISFLNDLLDIEYKIVDITYRNLEKLGLNIIDRKAVYDVYCTDEKNNNFIVELQRGEQKYFKDRSVYYTTFPIQEQSNRGDWNYELKKVYFVGILEFEMNKKNNDYLTKVQMVNTKTNEVFYDKLTYYYLELPKFKKSEKELANHLDYWLYYLNNLVDTKHIPKKLEKDNLLKEAFDVAEFLALSSDEKFAYQLDLKARLDYKNVLDFAKEKAKREGMEEGIKEGIEKGIQKGIQKGMEKGIIEMVKNLLDILDDETIAKKSGLSEEMVRELRLNSK